MYKNTVKIIVFSILSSFVFMSCTTTTGNAKDTPIPVVEGEALKKSHEVVGKCRVRYFVGDFDMFAVCTARLKQRAQELGADAITYPKAKEGWLIADAIKWK